MCAPAATAAATTTTKWGAANAGSGKAAIGKATDSGRKSALGLSTENWRDDREKNGNYNNYNSDVV